MSRFARRFLWFVAADYTAAGLSGLLGLYLPSDRLYGLCAQTAMFTFVAPQEIMMDYGPRASCYKHPPGGQTGCYTDAVGVADTQHAVMIVTLLCIAALIGGSLGLWGVWTRNRRTGKRVWLALSALSIGVALWNLQPFVFGSPYYAPSLALLSGFWAWAHASACWRAFWKT
jgi:hypothetical protein